MSKEQQDFIRWLRRWFFGILGMLIIMVIVGGFVAWKSSAVEREVLKTKVERIEGNYTPMDMFLRYEQDRRRWDEEMLKGEEKNTELIRELDRRLNEIESAVEMHIRGGDPPEVSLREYIDKQNLYVKKTTDD